MYVYDTPVNNLCTFASIVSKYICTKLGAKLAVSHSVKKRQNNISKKGYFPFQKGKDSKNRLFYYKYENNYTYNSYRIVYFIIKNEDICS